MCELPAVTARTPASDGVSRGTAVPAFATVVFACRGSVRVAGAPRTDLTRGLYRIGAAFVRSTTTGVTLGETASGLSIRSSASDPNDGGEVRSPRSEDTVVRPVPAADITSAVRTNRWSAFG